MSLALASCTPVPGGGAREVGSRPSGGLPAEEQLLVEPGHGSLRQEEFTLALLDGAVQVKVTPLEEWVIRLAAPDTYQRLSTLRTSHEAALDLSSSPDPKLFLVSFYTEEEGQDFYPEDLHLANRGRRQLPLAVRPMTPGWGTQRLAQRQAESAVYAFSGDIDLDTDLVVEYRGVTSQDWPIVLADLLAEQARVRAQTRAP